MPPKASPTPLRFLALATAVVGFSAAASRAEEKVDFEKEVLPLLDTACFKCHSAQAKKVKGDVRLDDLAAIRAKSRSDNLVFPHKPEKSLLYKVLTLPEGDDDQMPPPDQKKRLTSEQIALVKTWIEQGASFGGWKSAIPRQKPIAVEAEAVNPADVAATARRIDELVEAGLTAGHHQPNPPMPEDLWCRRAYLDLVGRIPTYDEIQAFLRSADPQKRGKLITALLASPGHVSAMFNYWCDVLRARSELAENVRGEYYLHYIKESLRSNKPYDAWTREMIGSDGEFAQSPAVGFHLRDLGNRFASVDNTATIFLGTQIGCAQCHDHPYDKWTRHDYHQFAAWYTGIETKRVDAPREDTAMESTLAGVRATLEKEAERRTSSQRRLTERQVAMKIFDQVSREMTRNRPPDFILRNGTEAKGRLPDNYQYPDGQPNQPIQPAVLFGEAPGSAAKPAETFAAWLASPKNDRFVLTITNRMWSRLMGAPFAGPIDNIRDVEDCANPALAAYLARVMVAVKFDLRQFQRIVASTRTYSRQAGTLAGPGAEYDFPGPVLRRMSAEQAWDSLMAMAVPDLDAKISFAAPAAPKVDAAKPADEDAILDLVEAEAHEEAKDVLKEMRRPPRPTRAGKEKAPYEPAKEFSPNGLLRASELPQPAPEGHFLRVFGQSNRELADGSWRAGTVPQTLMMLNSTLFDLLVQRGSPLEKAIGRDNGDIGRMHAAYLTILGRMPSMNEERLISTTFNGTGNTMAIAHSLLGTRQFLFIQ